MNKPIKGLSVLSVAGALLWFIAEGIEFSYGRYTTSSLYLSILGYLSLGVGLWYIPGKDRSARNFGLPATIVASAGLFIMAIMTVLAFETAVEFDRSFIRNQMSNPGFVAFIIGAFMLGIFMLRGSVFQKWSGMIMLLSPLLMFAVTTMQLATIWYHAAVFVFCINVLAIVLLPDREHTPGISTQT